MNARASIRWRLAAWNVGLLALLLLSGGGGLYGYFAHNLLRETDQVLRSKLDNFRESFLRQGGQAAFERRDLDVFAAGKRACPVGVVLQAASGAGQALLRSDNLKQYGIPLSAALRAAAADGRTVFRTVAAPGLYPMRTATERLSLPNGPDYFLQAGLCLEQNDALLRESLLAFLLGSLALLAVGTAVGLALLGKALKPLVELSDKAREITVERLDQLPQVPTSDEIGNLSTTLNEMLARLDRSIQQVKQFTGDVSHELKTPLTIIRGEAETMLAMPRAAAEYEGALRSILEEGGRMARIVDDLLTLARLDEPCGRPDFKTLRLDAFMAEVHEHAKALASSKRQRVSLERNDPAAVRGDELELRRLVLNLVDNAVRHTAAGGGIRLSLAAEPPFALLGVADDGEGIPPEALPHIFDRFFRVDKARARETGGAGLGLAICRQIAEGHGGRIEVESAVGHGSRFVVFLPLAPGR